MLADIECRFHGCLGRVACPLPLQIGLDPRREYPFKKYEEAVDITCDTGWR